MGPQKSPKTTSMAETLKARKFIIQGGFPLKGEVFISGNKNLATPLIASSILFDYPLLFKNVPDIIDVQIMLQILKEMGAKISFQDNILEIDSSKINPNKLNPNLVSKLRSSVLLIGPILARYQYIKMSQPGGCKIGARPLTTHLNAFRDLGVITNETSESIELKIDKKKPLQNKTVILDEFSVTATENMLLFLSLINKEFIIKLAAAEPHVNELCRFLKLHGVNIKTEFSHIIKIKGVKKMKQIKEPFCVDSDYAEAGTFIIMGALSKGKILLRNINIKYLDVVLSKFKKIGINYRIEKDNSLKIAYSPNLKATKIQTMPYPGFPTELQPQTGVLATQMQGTTYIHETLYEGRLKYLEELNKMGANSIIIDPHRAVIIGPTALYGREIRSLDIRSGISFIIAALIAQGETIISDIDQIDRGYEKIDIKLQNLGAKIMRTN